MPETAENTDIEPLTGRVAYVNNHNLFVSTKASVLQGGSTIINSDDGTKGDMLTKDGTLGLEYGTAVHRNEFGIDKGTFSVTKWDRSLGSLEDASRKRMEKIIDIENYKIFIPIIQAIEFIVTFRLL